MRLSLWYFVRLPNSDSIVYLKFIFQRRVWNFRDVIIHRKISTKSYPIYGDTSVVNSGDLSPFSTRLTFCVCDNEVYNVGNV